MKKTRKKEHKATKNVPNRKRDNLELVKFQRDIETVAYWTRSKVLTLQERESAAWLGAARAISSYDVSKGASLRTWTQLKARYAIEDEDRRERRQKRRFGKMFGVIWNAPHEDAATLDGYALARRERARELVLAALDSLDSRTREIIERVWYCGETQAEIANDFGFSQSWCSRLYRRGMALIKEILEPYFETNGQKEREETEEMEARVSH